MWDQVSSVWDRSKAFGCGICHQWTSGRVECDRSWGTSNGSKLMAIYAYLSSIVRQLIETFPDIFEGSDVIVDLACQMIKAFHSRRRSLLKQQQSGALSSKNHGLVLSVSVVFKFQVIVNFRHKLDDLPYSQPGPLWKKNERQKRRRIQKKKTILLISHSMTISKTRKSRKLRLRSPNLHWWWIYPIDYLNLLPLKKYPALLHL